MTQDLEIMSEELESAYGKWADLIIKEERGIHKAWKKHRAKELDFSPDESYDGRNYHQPEGFKRPGGDRYQAATPESHTMIQLGFFGTRLGSVVLTKQEYQNILEFYLLDTHEDNKLQRAGSQNQAIEQARNDGLRIMACISKFLERGEDPVKLVMYMASQAGFDMPLQEWPEGECSTT